mmetsp:Transcript_15904/g.40901  ORF Transcript_15904/g.40901 Transcript_15904/m.40901 type:complete len:358 (+) Transcript_15904:669-1742(+)
MPFKLSLAQGTDLLGSQACPNHVPSALPLLLENRLADILEDHAEEECQHPGEAEPHRHRGAVPDGGPQLPAHELLELLRTRLLGDPEPGAGEARPRPPFGRGAKLCGAAGERGRQRTVPVEGGQLHTLFGPSLDDLAEAVRRLGLHHEDDKVSRVEADRDLVADLCEVLDHLLSVAIVQRTPVVQENHAVHQGENLAAGLVQGADHCAPSRSEVLQHFDDLIRRIRVEAAGGLVQTHNVRPSDELDTDGGALALPTRQPVDHCIPDVGVRAPEQSQGAQQLMHQTVPILLWAREPQSRRKVQGLARSRRREHFVLLQHIGDPGAHHSGIDPLTRGPNLARDADLVPGAPALPAREHV